jgi:hypothetical protein
VGRITTTMQKSTLHGAVVTGKHRYTATARYIPAHHEVQLMIGTVKGKVRLQAALGQDQRRMIGTCLSKRQVIAKKTSRPRYWR